MDAVYSFAGAGGSIVLFYFFVKRALGGMDAVYSFAGAGRCFIQGTASTMDAVSLTAGTLRLFALTRIQRAHLPVDAIYGSADAQVFLCHCRCHWHQAKKQNNRKETGKDPLT
jgi:hypothetical protein